MTMPKEASRTPPFWVVRRMKPKQGGQPYHGKMFRHPTRESAETEAQRLAGLLPGVQFVVLEAVATFTVEAGDGTK